MRLGAVSSKRDFDHIWKNGVRARRDGIVASAVSATPGGERVGLIARSSSAVVRNRIKRRLRAVLAQIDRSGMDVVVSAEESAAKMPYEDLKHHVESALAAANRRGA